MTLSVLKKNLEKYTKENFREYVDRCLSEVQRVEYLLKSLQNFSLFENPELENVDISGFLEKLISLVNEDFSKKGIALDYNVFGEAKWVYADPRMLHQVMLNLLTNAADSFEGRNNPIIQITAMRSRICLDTRRR
jgi:nitrogen fixation/metabolism regulation signal transduction histidine kinase